MTKVYAPVAKAVAKGLFDPRDRVVFYQGGRAMLYRETTLRDAEFNPAVAKKLFKPVKEQMPDRMNAFDITLRKIVAKNLMVPVAAFPF